MSEKRVDIGTIAHIGPVSGPLASAIGSLALGNVKLVELDLAEAEERYLAWKSGNKEVAEAFNGLAKALGELDAYYIAPWLLRKSLPLPRSTSARGRKRAIYWSCR